jgi:hypothetical protein
VEETAAAASASESATPASGTQNAAPASNNENAAFVTCMAQQGVTVAEHDLPEHALLQEALAYLAAWHSGLDPSVRAGLDAATTDDPVSAHLADPAVNVAPALGGLLQAFDAASGKSLSELLEAAVTCSRS